MDGLDELIISLREMQSESILERVQATYPEYYELELEYQQYKHTFSPMYFEIWPWNVGSSICDHVQRINECYVFWIIYVILHIIVFVGCFKTNATVTKK